MWGVVIEKMCRTSLQCQHNELVLFLHRKQFTLDEHVIVQTWAKLCIIVYFLVFSCHVCWYISIIFNIWLLICKNKYLPLNISFPHLIALVPRCHNKFFTGSPGWVFRINGNGVIEGVNSFKAIFSYHFCICGNPGGLWQHFTISYFLQIFAKFMKQEYYV